MSRRTGFLCILYSAHEFNKTLVHYFLSNIFHRFLLSALLTDSATFRCTSGWNGLGTNSPSPARDEIASAAAIFIRCVISRAPISSAPLKTPGRYDDSQNKALPNNIEPEKDDEVHEGDVLLVRKNTYELVGRTALVLKTRPKLLLSDLTFRLVFRKEVLAAAYLWQAMNHKTTQARIQNLSGGSAGSMPNVSKERLKTLKLVPALSEQQKFAALVEKVESLRAKQKESQDELDNLFNSLMQRAFKGELVQ